MANTSEEKKTKALNIFKRFIVWLAWQFLRPKCDECPAHYVCEYAKIFEAKQAKKKEEKE